MEDTNREATRRTRRRELVRLQIWTLVAALVALTFGFLALIG